MSPISPDAVMALRIDAVARDATDRTPASIPSCPAGYFMYVPDDELSTFGVTHPERHEGPRAVMLRRLGYGITSLALIVLAALAVLDAVAPVFGVDSARVIDRGSDSTLLTVDYPELTRPALASQFAIEITRAGGFDAPIEVAVSRHWMEQWDENGFAPEPEASTGDREWVVYEFEPPDGDTLRVFYDARLEPARQEGIQGAVQLRSSGRPIAEVHFETTVRP